MAERRRIEVRAELVIEHAQHVAIERGGDAGGVVVGRVQHARVLHEVEAEEQTAVTPEQSPGIAQEPAARRRLEVPDRAPEEQHETASARRRHVAQVALEIADEAVDMEIAGTLGTSSAAPVVIVVSSTSTGT